MLSTSPAVRLTDTSVRRGRRMIWSGATFDVPTGSFAAVIGPNGAGKSTLINLLLGGLKPASGTVEVLGSPAETGNPRIGLVPQNRSLDHAGSILCRDLVALGLVGTRWGIGLRGPDLAAEVDDVLTAVDAQDYAHLRFGEVSGGQQKRISIAQALITKPDMLLLDEPLAGLDLSGQVDIVELVHHINHDRGVTVLFVTHDLNPLLAHIDSLVYLIDGTPRFGNVDDVVDSGLLTRRYCTPVQVTRTADGCVFTRTGEVFIATLVNSTQTQTGLSLLTSPFMINALIAGTLIAIASGAIGYFVLLRDLPFATHAVAHIGFPGATLAVLVGATPVVGLVAACAAGGIAIGAMGHRARNREVVTGTVLAFATGLGLLFNSLGSAQSGLLTNLLFGNILAITTAQVVAFTAIVLVVLVVLAATGRKLLFASVDPDVAAARGVNTRALSAMFLLAMSLIIAISVTVVGVLLIFALLVTPAATAIRLTARPTLVIAIASGIALVSVWGGLIVATYQPWPPSFVITTIACVAWIALPQLMKLRGPVAAPDVVTHIASS